MKKYLLNYYSGFKCVADRCKHTCCAGWEMCIDPETLQKYKDEGSDFAKALEKGVDFQKSKFKTDKLKRCAFLNEQNLCEIILNLGEKSLCQVCTDHPRFRTFFEDRIETGLGFSCEEATRLIMSFEEKIAPVLVEDDKSEQSLDFIQKSVLEFRESALGIIQDREKNINDRIALLLKLCRASLCEKDYKKTLKTFRSLEKLDKSWARRLKNIKGQPLDLDVNADRSLYCEQFLLNGIYRHLYNSEDTVWARAKTIALILSWWVIKSVLAFESQGAQPPLELVVDVVREFSSEVEYSQNNLDRLFAFAFRFVKL